MEVKFRADDHTDSNEKLMTTQRELRHAMTAMRLLSDASIRALGPVEVRAHPAVGGAGLGFGNPNDEVLGGKVENDKFLELDRKSCRVLKKGFLALGKDLPDALSIALARLNMSFTRGNEVDQFIDTIIGLEALYLGVESSELKFRLALRVSAHQEVEAAHRWKKFKMVQFLYDARSKLIHGSKHGLTKLITKQCPYANESDLLAGARGILRLGCSKAVLDRAAKQKGWKQYLEDIDKAVVSGL